MAKPNVPSPHRVCGNVSDDTRARIDKYAEAHGIRQPEAVKRLIELGLAVPSPSAAMLHSEQP